MVKTYMILRGENNNNADVLSYESTLRDAKNAVNYYYNEISNVFILMVKGSSFGEGYHQYTLENINGKWRKNTRI